MDTDSPFRFIRGRHKTDYLILAVAVLLFASNVLLEYSPLKPTGTLEVTTGPAIPQDENYTLTSTYSDPVSSAVLLDEPFDYSSLFCHIPVEDVNLLRINLTLQSDSDDTQINIHFLLGNYDSSTDIIVGTNIVNYEIEVDNTILSSCSEDWATYCGVYLYPYSALNLSHGIVWAEFSSPMSQLEFSFQSTDGDNILANNFTNSLRDFDPVLGVKPENNDRMVYFRAKYPNQTIYLRPQNYTFNPTWGAYTSFGGWYRNVTVGLNSSSIFTAYMKAIRVNLSVPSGLPMIRLELTRFSSYMEGIYELYLESSDFPSFVYVPPIPGFDFVFAVLSPFSSSHWFSGDIIIHEDIYMDGNNHLNLLITLPYLDIPGVLVTPQTLIQICLAILLTILIILRGFLFFQQKQPRKTWRDVRLIPVILIAMSSFLPWFYALRDPFWSFDAPMHFASFGVFPLVLGWTEGSSVFIVLASSGVSWIIFSLLVFWLPLMIANYLTTPGCKTENNIFASLLLFLPLYLLFSIQLIINDTFRYQEFFMYESVFYYLLLIPALFLCFNLIYTLAIWIKTRFRDQKPLMVEKQHQFHEKETQIDIQPSSKAAFTKKTQFTPTHREVQETMNVIIMILLYLLFIIPNSIGFRYGWMSNSYALRGTSFGNFLNGFGYFFRPERPHYPPNGILIIFVAFYYLLSLGLLDRFLSESRVVLSAIFLGLWVFTPLLTFPSVYYSITYRAVEYATVSLPYCTLNVLTILKLNDYVKGEISPSRFLLWLVIPIVAIIPGSILLNLFSSIDLAATNPTIAWFPIPIMTIVLFLLAGTLRNLYQNKLDGLEVDLEMDDMLLSSDETSDLG